MKSVLFSLLFCFLVIQNGFSQSASNYCQDAPMICSYNLNYHGYTLSSHTPYTNATDSIDEDDAPLGEVFCGSIENNTWVKFTAVDETTNIYFEVFNCSYGDGIQAEVFETSDCIHFVSVSNCEDTGYEVDFMITTTPLTPGNEYYLMIDGQAGDQCEYNFHISNALPTYSISEDTSICAGSELGLMVSGGTDFAWSPSEFLNDTSSTSPIAIPEESTLFSAFITGYENCPDTTLTVFVNLLDCDCEGMAGNDTSVCGITTQLNGEFISEDWSGMWYSDPGVTFSDLTDSASMAIVNHEGYHTIIWAQTDSLNNICRDTVLVHFLGGPDLDSVNIMNESYEGACDGEIETWFVNGSPPYSYLWSNSSTDCCPTNLCSGEYEITVTDENGCSNTQLFTVNPSAGIHEFAQNTVRLYPNPASHSLTVHLNNANEFEIQLINILGVVKGYYYSKEPEYSIDLSPYQAGIYFVNIKINAHIQVFKVIID